MKYGYIYILQSTINNKYYIGSTDNLTRRLNEHKQGKTLYVSKYIKEFNFVFSQKYNDIHIARNVEKWLKKQKDKDFIKRIIFEGKINKSF